MTYYTNYSLFPDPTTNYSTPVCANQALGNYAAGVYVSNGKDWVYITPIATVANINSSDPGTQEANVTVRILKQYVASQSINPPASSYIHDQAIPSSFWTVNHGLGYRPSITVVDSSDREVFGGDVQFIDDNNLTISFAAQFGGRAYFS